MWNQRTSKIDLFIPPFLRERTQLKGLAKETSYFSKTPKQSAVALQIIRLLLVISVLLNVSLTWTCAADQDPSKDSPGNDRRSVANQSETEKPDGLVRLSKKDKCWIDLKKKMVIVEGAVCQREAALEMFACPRGTKEHESIVAVDCSAWIVHAALLAIGAVPGTPVKFQPEYHSATGTEVDILIQWADSTGKDREVRAQDWLRNIKTDGPMKHRWVFSGSNFWLDKLTGKRHYAADAGDFICVSNFPSAMLDIPIESSQANINLLFGPATDRIPDKGTKVRLVLIPKLSNEKAKE